MIRFQQAAENSPRRYVLVERRFSVAFKSFISCHHEPTSVGEGSAFRMVWQTVQPNENLLFEIGLLPPHNLFHPSQILFRIHSHSVVRRFRHMNRHSMIQKP